MAGSMMAQVFWRCGGPRREEGLGLGYVRDGSGGT